MTSSFLVLFPLTFASDIFVSLATMPDWLQAIVRNNPVTHLAAASRALMQGTAPGADLWWVLGTTVGVLVVFAPIAMAMYRRER